eukprot:4942391-Pleurochrysis_carterae.AAC.1
MPRHTANPFCAPFALRVRAAVPRRGSSILTRAPDGARACVCGAHAFAARVRLVARACVAARAWLVARASSCGAGI